MKTALVIQTAMTHDAPVFRRARTLTEQGMEVRVFALRGVNTDDVTRCDGYEIHRVADFTTAPAYCMLSKLREKRARDRALEEAVVSFAPDVVHCVDTPALTASVAAASRLDAPYIYDALELYPDSLMQVPFRRSQPVQAYLRQLEARRIPGAAATLVVSPGQARVLSQRYGVDSAVLPNVPDLLPLEGNSLLREATGDLEGKALLLYQGGLLIGRGLDDIVEAMAHLPGCHLAIEGSGPMENDLRERIAGGGLTDRISVLGRVDMDDIFAWTRGADVGLMLLDGVTLNHQLTWPNRVFNFMMAAMPLVCTDLPGLRELFEPLDAALFVPRKERGPLVEALTKLSESPALAQQMGARGREAVEKTYNWEIQSRTLLDAYDRVLSGIRR